MIPDQTRGRDGSSPLFRRLLAIRLERFLVSARHLLEIQRIADGYEGEYRKEDDEEARRGFDARGKPASRVA